MNDKKHIRRDFHSVAWVMPQGGTLGRWGARVVILFFKHGHVAYQIDEDDEQNASKIFILRSNW